MRSVFQYEADTGSCSVGSEKLDAFVGSADKQEEQAYIVGLPLRNGKSPVELDRFEWLVVLRFESETRQFSKNTDAELHGRTDCPLTVSEN